MSHRMLKHLGLFLLALSVASISRTVSAGDPIAMQAGKKSITGTVVNVDNAPAASTEVSLYSLRSKPVGPVPRPPGDPGTGDSSIGTPGAMPLQKPREILVMKTQTDAAGKFTFNSVTPGPYNVTAGTGRNVASIQVDVTDKAAPAPLSLKLPSK